MKYSIKSIVIIISILSFLACEKENAESKISYYNDNESHNMGQNCMNCHYQGGPGEYTFTIAGTVYDSSLVTTYPNTTVKLYSGSNATGELKYTIQADALGNFYSSELINFETGLYASVEGSLQTIDGKTTLQGKWTTYLYLMRIFFKVWMILYSLQSYFYFISYHNFLIFC